MASLREKRIKVSRGYSYTYYTVPPSSKLNKPTLLLFHGWPDSALNTWYSLCEDYLIPEGYGILAPDCLAWAGSDKPLDEREYDFRSLSQDVVEMLKQEGIENVIVAGHDWGVAIASRFYNYNPQRSLALMAIASSYLRPQLTPFSVEEVNAATTTAFGYPILSYWSLFASDEGASIMEDHLEALWHVLHGPPESWMNTFCAKDGILNFLLEEKRQPLMLYATEERKKQWMERISRDGLAAPQMWYRSLARGYQDEANREAMDGLVVNVPYLFVAGGSDVCCRVEGAKRDADEGITPDGSVRIIVGAGHWPMLSHPKEFGEAVVGWLRQKEF